MFKSIRRTRVSDEVISQVKNLILEGKLKPGDRLPPERELIKQFGVSRPSLREALNSLVGMGFLEATQGNRTVVKSLVSGKIFEPLDNLLKEDIRTVFELIEVRKAIETWNAYFAAQRAASEDILNLERIIESMRRSLEKGGLFLDKEDADFHLAISQATHNKIQTHIMHTLHQTLKEFLGKYYHKLNETELFQQHLGIVDAIKQRQSDLARTRILQHLEYVESCVKEAIEYEKKSENSN